VGVDERRRQAGLDVLDKARRILDATTETEALDRALTLVVSEAEIDAALRHLHQLVQCGPP